MPTWKDSCRASKTAAADLVDNKCDSVIIGGSPLFTKLGYGSDIEMGKRLSDKYGVPVSPGITGEIEALKSLGINKLVVATPHEDTLNERMKAFLEASGFKVLKIQGYGVRKNADITDMDEHAAYKIAKRLYESAPEADGVFVPCPRWPTITDVDLLEREIGKPVITSSQAYIWHALEDGEGEARSERLRQIDGIAGELMFRHYRRKPVSSRSWHVSTNKGRVNDSLALCFAITYDPG